MGDAVRGKVLFVRMCAMCHTDDKNGKHRVGPNLFGIMGKTCGTTPGFKYTDSMKKKAIIWDEAQMNDYLEAPRTFIPGTRMVFIGVKNMEQRRDIIAYLATLK